MFFSPLARKIAIVNALGLFFGIHCFYGITHYRLLRYMGDRNFDTKRSMATINPAQTGWVEHVDKSTGVPFYHNAQTGETSWENPLR